MNVISKTLTCGGLGPRGLLSCEQKIITLYVILIASINN